MGRPRKAAAQPNAESSEAPALLPPSKRPLPTIDEDKLPSRLEIPSELGVILEEAMKARGADPKATSRKEFFELLMWEWLLTGEGKRFELAARILGRGYIGEKSDSEKTTEKLCIEDYRDGVANLMAPGKKVK